MDKNLLQLKKLGLKDAPYYVKKFCGKKFIIKFGGTIIEDSKLRQNLLKNIILLSKLGIFPTIVHGGSVQADLKMKEKGIIPCRHNGLRITCAATIAILEECFGWLNQQIVDEIISLGGLAKGFSGFNGNLIKADKLNFDVVNIGYVGTVSDVNLKKFYAVYRRKIPVIASLGIDKNNTLLNINADYVASQVGIKIGADKLIFISDVKGVMYDIKDESSLVSTLTVKEAEKLIKEKIIDKGMIPKVESAINAVKMGLGSVHLISGLEKNALLKEIFTSGGTGTLITV